MGKGKERKTYEERELERKGNERNLKEKRKRIGGLEGGKKMKEKYKHEGRKR